MCLSKARCDNKLGGQAERRCLYLNEALWPALTGRVRLGDYVYMKKPLRLRLPFGTLKVATYLQLSSAEHDGLVPYKWLGRLYLIWKATGLPSRDSR